MENFKQTSFSLTVSDFFSTLWAWFSSPCDISLNTGFSRFLFNVFLIFIFCFFCLPILFRLVSAVSEWVKSTRWTNQRIAAHQRQQPLQLRFVKECQKMKRLQTDDVQTCSKDEHPSCPLFWNHNLFNYNTLIGWRNFICFDYNKWNCLHFSMVPPLSEEEGLFSFTCCPYGVQVWRWSVLRVIEHACTWFLAFQEGLKKHHLWSTVKQAWRGFPEIQGSCILKYLAFCAEKSLAIGAGSTSSKLPKLAKDRFTSLHRSH